MYAVVIGENTKQKTDAWFTFSGIRHLLAASVKLSLIMLLSRLFYSILVYLYIYVYIYKYVFYFPYRLEAYDRNSNFTGGANLVADQNDFNMILPAHTCFKDVTSDAVSAVNHLSCSAATAFLELSDASLSSGHRLNYSRYVRQLQNGLH